MDEQRRRRRSVPREDGPGAGVLPPQQDNMPLPRGPHEDGGAHRSARPWRTDPQMQSFLPPQQDNMPQPRGPHADGGAHRSARPWRTDPQMQSFVPPQTEAPAQEAAASARRRRMNTPYSSGEKEEAVVLEPIRKQDYQGRAEAYKNRQNGRVKGMRNTDASRAAARPTHSGEGRAPRTGVQHTAANRAAETRARHGGKKRKPDAASLLLAAQEAAAGALTYLRRTVSAGAAQLQKTASGQDRIRLIACVLLVCVALFSLCQIIGILWRTARTKSLNEELSQRRAALSQDVQDLEDVPYGIASQGLDTANVTIYTAATAEPAQAAIAAVPEATKEPSALSAQETEQPAAAQPTAVPIQENVVRTTKYRSLGGNALPEMEALYNENRDLVAWINIPEVLDLPIVYRDNSYYLKRDFYKQKNTSGTLFLDVNHPFKEKTQNLLLHGHNMKDGTMFGRLTHYLTDNTYLRNHPFINFNTLWNREQYVIFAVLNVSLDVKDERFFNYFTHPTFSMDSEFEAYIRQLQLRSEYAIPIDVQPSDALLTLSTCLEEDRLVIVARRLREGETRSELRELIRTASRQ